MSNESPVPDALARAIGHVAASASDGQIRFMELLAERQREPKLGKTTVEEAEEFFKERQGAVSFLKQLGDAGCGQFVTGRRGQPTRIEWAECGAIPIAKAFINARTQPQPDPAMPDVNTLADCHWNASPAASPVTSAKLHPHTFLLRPELSVRVELPLNLTKEEANRFADFIRTIPF